jgi:hypothetical protein
MGAFPFGEVVGSTGRIIGKENSRLSDPVRRDVNGTTVGTLPHCIGVGGQVHPRPLTDEPTKPGSTTFPFDLRRDSLMAVRRRQVAARLHGKVLRVCGNQLFAQNS